MIFVNSSPAPWVWAVMYACTCRQPGSLTLGNVKCAMNLNSVLTKCSQDPVNSPSGGVCMWQALWKVWGSHPREDDNWLVFSLPSFQVLSPQKAAATAKNPPMNPAGAVKGASWCMSSTKVKRDPLATGSPASSKAMVRTSSMGSCDWSPFFWQLCQLRWFLLLVPVAISVAWRQKFVWLYGESGQGPTSS